MLSKRIAFTLLPSSQNKTDAPQGGPKDRIVHLTITNYRSCLCSSNEFLCAQAVF
jgi:hypothetical protein